MTSDPVLFIPGQLCTEEIWRPQLDALGQAHRSIVGDQTRDDTVGGMAARILADAPGRFALAAHAMGGFVAFEIMRRAPDRVARLLLLGTLASADTPVQIERRRGYERLVHAGKFDQIVNERLPLLFHPERVAEPELIAIAARMAAATGPEAFLRQQNAIITRPDSTATLPHIHCPTTFIVGRQDRLASVEVHEEMARPIGGATLHVIENCGHFCTIEQPGEVNRLMLGWLET